MKTILKLSQEAVKFINYRNTWEQYLETIKQYKEASKKLKEVLKVKI